MKHFRKISTVLFGSILSLGLVTLASVSPVLALDLDSAKASGQVGEQTNGYLGSVAASPSADVIRLINDINQKRKNAYQDIARKNGTNLSDVEKLAAQKAIEKTATGHYVQVNGQWVKK